MSYCTGGKAMSWGPGGKTFSVFGCHFGKVGKFLGGKIKFGGISAVVLTAEAVTFTI